MTRSRVPLFLALAIGFAVSGARPGAQPSTPASQPDPLATLAPSLTMAAGTAQLSEESVTLVYTNRPIVAFRATVLARPPAVRAAATIELLDRLVEENPDARAVARRFADGVVIALGDRPVFAIFNADVDPLAGESLDGNGAAAAVRLDQAFREAIEIRTPRTVLYSIGFAVVVTALYLFGLWLIIRFDRRLAVAAYRAAERRLREMAVGELMVHVRAPILLRRFVGLLGIVAGLLLTYGWLGALLRRFPYTRPWGEHLRSRLLHALTVAGESVLAQLPNLLVVLCIILITRFMIRLLNLAFEFIEAGRVTVPWIHPETAQPTRRIAVALLWLFALIVSYGYLPGSQSEVFKGVSVFVGLVVSLGSSGVMNQVMSGLMVTYSRALRPGDFVRIADVEGTVTHLGTLSTKVRTPRNEEITIPNAVVVSQATTNFSRHAEQEGVFAPTTITIGYDTPWRQVHALLLLAAERTTGVRQTPKPAVMQTALTDFYVQYTLLVCLANPAKRLPTLNELHANIQDAFNEYGVQIMSPNYEADPEGRKVVPPSQWYAAPAAPPAASILSAHAADEQVERS